MAPTEPPSAPELVFYDWEEDIPQSVIDAFTAEFQIKVTYLTYETSEEGAQNIRDGKVYDVVVMENHYVAVLAAEKLLAEINYSRVPNFDHILPGFRDLIYDPGIFFSVPFNWGTTALVVRSDLIDPPVTRWADLWDTRFSGRIGLWKMKREVIGFTLKSLGYSANSEDLAQIEEAGRRLMALAPSVRFIDDSESVTSAPLLLSGDIVIAHGYAYDALTARAENPAISYVLPEEGPLLWGDNFVIPANSPNKDIAELFINFLLRPEVAAQIARANTYATANADAIALLDDTLRNDPVIYPPGEDLARAEVLLPLDPKVEAVYDRIWAEFVAAVEANP